MEIDIKDFMVSVREVPKEGHARMLIRLELDDRKLINDAAWMIGMTQQAFMRSVLVSAAKRVMKEAGVQL